MQKIFLIILILISSSVFSQNQEEVINQLINQLEESTNIIIDLRDENQELNQIINNLRDENQELKQTIDDLRNEEQVSNNSNICNEADCSEFENQIIVLLERLEESNDTIILLRDRIQKDQEEIVELRNSIEELIPLIDDKTFGIGATYNLPTGISIIGEFKIPSFPVSIIGQAGYFDFVYGGIGIKLDF